MFPSQAAFAAHLSSVAHAVLAANTSTGTSTGSSKSSPYGTVFLVVALFAVVYLFLIRPQRRRAQQAAATASTIEPGQKVLTRHGQIAYVVEVDGDEIVLEIAPRVHSRFVKEAIARVIPPPEPDEGITDPAVDPSYGELPDDPETEVQPDPDTEPTDSTDLPDPTDPSDS